MLSLHSTRYEPNTSFLTFTQYYKSKELLLLSKLLILQTKNLLATLKE